MIRLTYGNVHHTYEEAFENRDSTSCHSIARAANVVYEQRCEFFEAVSIETGEDLTHQVRVFVKHLRRAEQELKMELRNKVQERALREHAAELAANAKFHNTIMQLRSGKHPASRRLG